MRHAWILCLLVACGGGGTAAEEAAAGQPLSVQEVFDQCVASDAVEISALLELLQGFFSDEPATIPQPEFNLLAGLLSGGVVPYTWDLDEDGVDELAGNVRFLDADGNTTIPFDIQEILASGIDDPLDLLAQAPDGTSLELTFALGGLLLDSAADASGEGTLVFSIEGGMIAGASGSGTFEAGPCLLDFSFEDVAVDLLDEFPAASLEFDARIGDDVLSGSIEFDGTGTATVVARLNDEPEERFEIDLSAP